MNQQVKVHLSLFTVALLYGANYSIAKLLMPLYIQPFGVIVIRVVVAALLFSVFHHFTVHEQISDRRDYFKLAVCAFFGVALNQLLFFKGLSLTTPIHASLVMTTSPIFVLIVSAFLLKERISVRKIAGILLGAIGAILLITEGGLVAGGNTMLGDIMVACNGLSFAIFLVIVKPLNAKYHPFTIIKWVFLMAVPMVLPFGLDEFLHIEWQSFSANIWWALGFVVIGATFMAYLLNNWALRYVNASTVGIYIYLQPVIATLIAVIAAQDILTPAKSLYAFMIFAGVFMVSKKSSAVSPASEELSAMAKSENRR